MQHNTGEERQAGAGASGKELPDMSGYQADMSGNHAVEGICCFV